MEKTLNNDESIINILIIKLNSLADKLVLLQCT